MDITKRKLTKIAREINKFTTRTLRAYGVGSSEFDLIHVVRHRPGVTQAEICRILGIDKAAAARQTANLESKGFLTRKKNPSDGRSQILFATEKAETLKNSKTEIETMFYEWLLEALTEDDQNEFARLLDILYHRSKTESKADFPNMTKRVEQDNNLLEKENNEK